jgi:uncharacterized RDD family membrane protein YckC
VNTARPARFIHTPEHVLVRLTPAGPGSRFLALLVDASFAAAVSGFAARLLNPLLPPSFAFSIFATFDFVVTWGYHVYFELRQRGQTPGKRLLGLRVVDGRGLPLSVAQSFVRNVARVLDFMPAFYGVGAVALALDPYGRRLGDIVADTLVVQEANAAITPGGATRKEAPTSLRTPRLVRLIRRSVGVEEREFIAQLLLRADALVPQARFDLFEEVGGLYRRRLEIDDRTLSGENLVRGVASILFSESSRAARGRSASISAAR